MAYIKFLVRGNNIHCMFCIQFAVDYNMPFVQDICDSKYVMRAICKDLKLHIPFRNLSTSFICTRHAVNSGTTACRSHYLELVTYVT